MKCGKCQFENIEGARFCNECGAPLEELCPDCGKTNPPSARFCNQCGRQFAPPPVKPPIDYDQPQTYTPKPLAQKILTQRKQLEGERKLVTVFFSDVKGSTAMGERLDPEEVHRIIEGWYGIIMDEVHRYEGTITQFMGDGVMALFGAPVGHEDHARRACLAGLAVQERVRGYAEQVDAKHGIEFRTRIGLNSGLVIVTSVGDDLKMDYTAIGDTVNLAARMESAADPGTVLVSENTCKLCRSYFEFKSVGALTVKGKKEPQAAYEVIATSDVATRLMASAARGFTRFVGRKKEIASLLDCFNQVKAGAGQVVGIVGEAGVGKSRLLYELRNLLSPDEYIYLEGSCLQYGGAIIYKPVLDVLKIFFGLKEGESEQTQKERLAKKLLGLDEKLASALPPLQDLLSLTVDDAEVVGASSRSRSVGRDREVSPTIWAKLEPKVRREKTFEALRNLLIRAGQEKPLVLAVEDLHWMDKSSEEFLDFFIGALTNSRVLLLLLYRPEYMHQWGSKTYYHKIGLDQLPLDQCAELVRSILVEGDLCAEIKDLILSRAAGNPLFMEEMTHTLLENGSIKKEDHQYVLTRPASQIEVPDTVQAVIAARMDRLEESVKRTMQVAAVIGRDFAFRLLHAITEMREDLKSHLGRLQGLEFIYQKNLFPELEYIFKHALTQEVAYNSLLLQRRKELHEKIGQAIEQIYADRLDEFYEILAYHYSRAENWESAGKYFKLAGEKAAANYANREAFLFYKESLAAIMRLPETAEKFRSLLEVYNLLSIPMALIGYPEDSLEILQEKERIIQKLGDDRALAKFFGEMATYYLFKEADPVKGLAYSEKGYHEARKSQDLELIVELGTGLVISYHGFGRKNMIAEIAPEIISRLEKAGKESDFHSAGINTNALICSEYGLALAYMGKFQEAKIILEKGLKFAQQIGDLPSLALVEGHWGWAFFSIGDGVNMFEHMKKSKQYAKQANWLWAEGVAEAGICQALHLMGDLKSAKEHGEAAIEMLKSSQNKLYISLAYNELIGVYLDLGELEKAQDSAQKVIDFEQELDNKSMAIIYLGRIKGKTNQSHFEEARRLIEEGLAIREKLNLMPLYAVGLYFLGELYADAGRKAEAREHLEKALTMMAEMGLMYWPEKARAVLGVLEA